MVQKNNLNTVKSNLSSQHVFGSKEHTFAPYAVESPGVHYKSICHNEARSRVQNSVRQNEGCDDELVPEASDDKQESIPVAVFKDSFAFLSVTLD